MKKINFIWLAMLFVFVAGNAFSQTEKREYPQLKLKETGSTVELASMGIDVKVVGKMATTTFDFSFYNKEDRVFEGEFIFPLGDGHRVSRFAMDVNGALREAVVVEKQKGQQVFESVVRKNIDPGLLEKTKGNNYRTRVYPIPAKGYKRVLIAYEQELTVHDNGLLYQLPLFFGEEIRKFKLCAEVFRKKAKLDKKENSLENFRFKRWDENYKAEFEQEKFKADKLLSFFVPQQERKPEVYIEKAQKQAGHAFYMNFLPKTENRAKVLPKKIALLWDASYSMEQRDKAKELALLDAYFKKIGNLKVTFQTFAHAQNKAKTYKVKDGDWTDLRKAIESVAYESASRFDALDLSKLEADEILFFTDGLATIGKSELKPGSSPIICINSAAKADFSFLRYVATMSGGQLLNLASTATEQAVESLSSQKFQFISAEFEKGAIEESFPAVATAVSSDFSFAGILKQPNAKLKLNFGFGTTVTFSKTISLDTKKLSETNGLVERMWAYKKLDHLELQKEKNQATIYDVAKDYTIVTDNASLIILDRLIDYLEHRIVPPAELQKEYFTMLEKYAKEHEATRKDVLAKSIASYKARIKWWEKEVRFDLEKWKAEKERRKASGDTVSSAQLQEEVEGEVMFSRRRQSRRANGQRRGRMENYFSVRAADVNQQRARNEHRDSIAPQPPRPNAQLMEVVDDEEIEDEMVIESVDGVQPEAVPRRHARRSNRAQRTGVWSTTSATDQMIMIEDPEEGEIRNANLPQGQNTFQWTVTEDESSASKIKVAAWDPKTPYIDSLKAAKDGQRALYFELRKANSKTPAFFLDVAEFFYKKGEKEKALAVLLTVVELDLENHRLLRIVARKLQEWGHKDLAVTFFEEVLRMRPQEPQSLRDLGLAYERTGQYQRAVDTLYQVAVRRWERFRNIVPTVITEMNAIIAQHKVNTTKIDTALLKNLPMDVRIVLNWDTDNSDMDLWVTDPIGEKCYYKHKKTEIGAWLPFDHTGGYGPEEFMLRKATDGKFAIDVNYYGSNQQGLIGPTTIQLELITNFGTPKQKRQEVTLRLGTKKEVLRVGELEFGE